MHLEKTKLSLGIIALTDCAVLVMAKEKGYFAEYGLDVELSREASWATIRDKVAMGALDGAQMLAPMPIAATLGVDAVKTPMLTAFTMDLNGNAITVSTALYERMVEVDPEAMASKPVSARALKRVIDLDRAAGRPPLTFAQVFPYSTHNYQLRYWMASAGIDPDRDLRLIVIPPPQMSVSLQERHIDGCCVGEPWNARAVQDGVGRTLITSYELWNNAPEKVFGVTRAWAEANPETHVRVIQALLETARWMDRPENRMEVVETIAQEHYINAPVDVVKMSMTGTFQYSRTEPPRPLPDFNVFHRYAANFPWRSHGEWFVSQMYRWGQVDRVISIRQAVAEIYRPDIYREAAQRLGIPHPGVDHKAEGQHGDGWTLDTVSEPIEMGSDLFFDGGCFDPTLVADYIAGFEVKALRVGLKDLASANA